MKINILIRSHRPHLLQNAVNSVMGQTFKDWNIIVYKNGGGVPGYDYNLFCNILKDQVEIGWFMFLDDDDVLDAQDVLEKMAKRLTDPDELIICQMLRKGRAKPHDGLMSSKRIVRGHIGMPCFFLHSKHKHIAEFDNTECADYNFIKQVSEKLRTKFIKQVVVNAGKRSNGK